MSDYTTTPAEDVAGLLTEAAEDGIFGNIGSVESFQDGGVLTSDAGFTIRLDDGSAFQVTVVQSEQAR